jgi:hypothetical protein
MSSQLPIPPAVLDQLARVNDGLDPGMNKHDRVSVLIPVCIMEGITDGKLICLALKLLRYNPRHVGLILHNGSASMPPEHRWYKDSDSHCRLP